MVLYTRCGQGSIEKKPLPKVRFAHPRPAGASNHCLRSCQDPKTPYFKGTEGSTKARKGAAMALTSREIECILRVCVLPKRFRETPSDVWTGGILEPHRPPRVCCRTALRL